MDPIAVWGLVVGAIGTAAAVVGAVAAIYAARYAKASPTKEDLARVEEHLAEQNKRELLSVRVEHVAVFVTARSPWTDPLGLNFALKDPDVTLLRVGLLNNRDMRTETASCAQTGPLTYTAVVDRGVAQKWFDSAGETPHNSRPLKIRALIRIDGTEHHRDLSVQMTRGQTPTGTVWLLDGSC